MKNTFEAVMNKMNSGKRLTKYDIDINHKDLKNKVYLIECDNCKGTGYNKYAINGRWICDICSGYSHRIVDWITYVLEGGKWKIE